VLKNSEFSGNIGAEGGAIATGGHLDVESSLFYNNTAHREGASNGGGGAIASGGVVTLTNSTFVSNYSTLGGGAIASDAEMTVTNCTFSFNTSPYGGAFHNTSNLTLRNSIIANSMWSDSCFGWGTINDGGGNLRWPAADETCVGEFGDPRLEPLADNGGPTLTMALPTGSPAIQFAADNCPAADQRGMPRSLWSNRCDAGAYELQSLSVFVPVVYNSP
jgi:predicted outer membrane repeat protein